MKQKPSIYFLVGAGVAGVLIIGSAVLLFLGCRNLAGARKKLDENKTTLDAFYKQNPFAATRNVKREDVNAEILKDWYSNLVESASADQLEVDVSSRSKFINMLSLAKKRVEDRAEENDVKIEGDRGLGFEIYFSPESPVNLFDKVSRLVEQLTIVEETCNVLIDERVHRLYSFNREVFETAREGAKSAKKFKKGTGGALPASPNAGKLGEDELYAKFRFKVEFVATENALLRILNRLSSHERFFVPVHLQLRKDGDDVLAVQTEDVPTDATRQASTGESVEGEAQGDEGEVESQVGRQDSVKSPQERMICGLPLEQPSIVTLTFDVYKFRKEPDA